MNNERKTYQELKDCALNSYFDFCRDRGIVLSMSHLEVIGYIDYDFEDGFENPIEDLMWRVILLVLSGGWHSDWCKSQREFILKSIANSGLNNLLEGLPADELEIFKHDLLILRLID